jgi:Spy/CpxP family protein refolding chaperone
MTGTRRPVGPITSAIAALLIAAGAMCPALAQAPPPRPGPYEPGMRWGMGRPDGELSLMIRAGNLTPEQQAKVRGILSAHRSATRPVIEQLRLAQQELGAKLLAPGPIQTSDLQPQLERIGRLRDQLAQDSAQAALEVRGVLTPEPLVNVLLLNIELDKTVH